MVFNALFITSAFFIWGAKPGCFCCLTGRCHFKLCQFHSVQSHDIKRSLASAEGRGNVFPYFFFPIQCTRYTTSHCWNNLSLIVFKPAYMALISACTRRLASSANHFTRRLKGDSPSWEHLRGKFNVSHCSAEGFFFLIAARPTFFPPALVAFFMT